MLHGVLRSLRVRLVLQGDGRDESDRRTIVTKPPHMNALYTAMEFFFYCSARMS
jgi:hypothetical protein